jgi:hypothetical protein
MRSGGEIHLGWGEYDGEAVPNGGRALPAADLGAEGLAMGMLL